MHYTIEKKTTDFCIYVYTHSTTIDTNDNTHYLLQTTAYRSIGLSVVSRYAGTQKSTPAIVLYMYKVLTSSTLKRDNPHTGRISHWLQLLNKRHWKEMSFFSLPFKTSHSLYLSQNNYAIMYYIVSGVHPLCSLIHRLCPLPTYIFYSKTKHF